MTDTLEDRTSCLGHKYNLIDALRRAKVQIKAGDFITDIAADRIAELEAEAAQMKKRIADLESMLIECLEYFDNRMDADDGPYGPEPNEEMRFVTSINELGIK